MHSTLEKENNSTLPFLDVLVSKETSVFLMTVYCKAYFYWLIHSLGFILSKKAENQFN